MSSVSRFHTVRGENQFLEVVLFLHCTPQPGHALRQRHTQKSGPLASCIPHLSQQPTWLLSDSICPPYSVKVSNDQSNQMTSLLRARLEESGSVLLDKTKAKKMGQETQRDPQAYSHIAAAPASQTREVRILQNSNRGASRSCVCSCESYKHI